MKLRFYLTTICLAVAALWSTLSATDIWQREKGYRGFADVGIMFPLGIGEEDGGFSPLNCELSFSTTHGYQVVPSYLFIGGGVGLDFYLMSMYIPVYADFRTQFPTGKWSPFIDVKLGYGANFIFLEMYNGAFHFEPTIGVTLSTKRRIGFDFGLSYTLKRMYDTSYETVTVNGRDEERKCHDWYNHNGIKVKFGITF